MRARDSARLSTVRLLLAAVKQKEVDERIELTDVDVVTIIEKMIKQRLPQKMSDSEVAAAVAAAVSETGASGIKDMGKVMALLKPRLAGRADMGAVSALVKTKLSG